MSFGIGATRISFHPLLPLLAALAASLGPGHALGPLAGSLALHEAGHLLAARLVGVRVTELRLMPFGGAAQLGNLYALAPGQLLAIAAAGPAVNLALLCAFSAAAQWRWIEPLPALEWARVNLALMLFNLLPALPLDGGRMLYALTAGRLGRSRAAALGIALGRALAAALLALAGWGWLCRGQLNLSPIACAVFIFSSAAGEREALTELNAVTLLNALRRVRRPIEMKLRAVSADCPAVTALRHAAPDAATLFAVYRDSRLTGFADERQLLTALLSDPGASVAQAAPNEGRHRKTA